MSKIAWVAGATGLVGGHLMQQLAAQPDYAKVVALVRKPSQAAWSKLDKVSQQVVDFEALDDSLPVELKAQGVDDLFCALGTTKKKTPDAKAYYQIDVNYPLFFAQLGAKLGARFYGVVSAHGANSRSMSSYFKMKGEMEAGLKVIPYPVVAIARPGMLKGDRGEFRILEKAGEYITDLLPGNYRTIAGADVAAALIEAANNDQKNLHILASKHMQGAQTRLRHNPA